MKNIFFAFGLAMVLSGCLSPAPKAPVNWTIEYDRAASKSLVNEPKFAALRVSSVDVRAPYDGKRLAVLRADGSVAFDGYNVFAAQPVALFRGAAEDVLRASGYFGSVVGGTSFMSTSLSCELTITRLALDCRAENQRDALVELSFLMLDGRKVVSTSSASAVVAVKDGRYSEAFSQAFAEAMASMLKKL